MSRHIHIDDIPLNNRPRTSSPSCEVEISKTLNDDKNGVIKLE